LSKNVNKKYSPFISVIKGAGYMLLGNFVLYFLGFIYHIPVIRILGPEEYGLWSLVYSIVITVAPFSMFGIGTGVMYYLSKAYTTGNKNDVRDIILAASKILLFSSLIVTSGTFIFSMFGVEKIYSYTGIRELLSIMTFTIPLFAIVRFGEAIFKTVEDVKAIYKIKISQDLFKLIFIPIVLWVTTGNLTLMAMFTLISFIVAGVSTGCLLNKLVIPLRDVLKGNHKLYTKKLLNFSWPLLINEYVQILGKRVDIFFIAYFLTKKAVGIYRPALVVAGLTSFIPEALRYLAFPILSKIYSSGNIESLVALVKRIYKYIFYLNIPIINFIILFSEDILSFLYGKIYREAALCLMFLSLGMGALTFYALSGYIVNIHGKTKLAMFINVLGMIFNGIANYFLIPKYRIIGAAIATFLSFLLICILMNLSAIVLLKKNFFPVETLGILISGGIIVLIAFFLKERSGLFNVITYSCSLLFVSLWGVFFEREEIKKIWSWLLYMK